VGRASFLQENFCPITGGETLNETKVAQIYETLEARSRERENISSDSIASRSKKIQLLAT